MVSAARVVRDDGVDLTPPRGRLGRYALWQLKDFAVQRAAAMLAVALVLAYPVVATNHAEQTSAVERNGAVTTYQNQAPDPVEAATGSLLGVVYPVMIVGVILAIRGLTSDDRRHGYHRFLFAKPVSITRYYAQAYAVQFAGYLAVVGLLIGLFALFLRPVAVMPGLFASAALLFALVGSLGFLLSTLVRADWLWLLVIVGLATLAAGAFERSDALWPLPFVLLLPPVQTLVNVMGALVSPTAAVDSGELLWVLGYAGTYVLLALYTLRRRALPA